MFPLETIIATVLASAFSGTLALYVTHRKQRQLEGYKATLQAELEQSKLQTQNDLQIKFFEYQTRFSLLHQKQADVIKDLYGLLGETNEYIIQLVSPTFDITNTTHVETTSVKYNALAECFVKNRIYLEEETCSKIADLLLKFRMAMMKSSLGQRPERGGHGVELWGEAWESVRNRGSSNLEGFGDAVQGFLVTKLKSDSQQALGRLADELLNRYSRHL